MELDVMQHLHPPVAVAAVTTVATITSISAVTSVKSQMT